MVVTEEHNRLECSCESLMNKMQSKNKKKGKTTKCERADAIVGFVAACAKDELF